MLNITARQMMSVVFPFVIVDLYLKEVERRGGRGYFGWLLAASIHLIQTNALVLAGPFRALSLDNGYAVILLTLTAFVFYFLSVKGTGALGAAQAEIPQDAVSLQSLKKSFKEHGLSEREAEVALLMAREGLGNKEIGDRLYISPLTIKSHVSQIFQKYGVKKRAEFLVKVLNK
jgi:DNA-binding CsgD family transcriptional regulator